MRGMRMSDIKYENKLVFTISFDKKFCDLDCGGLKIPTNPDEYSSTDGWGHDVLCEVFRGFPATMFIDGVLRIRRCSDCIKKYGVGEDE